MSCRAGLSRAEVLVGFLIIVAGVGLVLPGIGRMRETAALATCQNNLRQLGLSFHAYGDANAGRLPPLADQGEGALTGHGIPSVFATITPYIEARPDFYRQGRPPTEYHANSSVHFTFHNKDGTTSTSYGGMANQPWRVFLCPSDPTADQLHDVPMTLPDGSTGYYATGSYAANGLLPWGARNLSQPFPDGLANTVLLAERPQVCRTTAGDTVYNLWGVGFYSPHTPAFAALTPTDPPGLWSTGQVAPVAPLPDEQAADRNTAIQYRIGRRDAAPQPPDFPTPIQLLGQGRPCDPRLPGSPHKTGVQVLMADRSVRVFGPDTEPWVFWAACTPNDLGGRAADGR